MVEKKKVGEFSPLFTLCSVGKGATRVGRGWGEDAAKMRANSAPFSPFVGVGGSSEGERIR